MDYPDFFLNYGFGLKHGLKWIFSPENPRFIKHGNKKIKIWIFLKPGFENMDFLKNMDF